MQPLANNSSLSFLTINFKWSIFIGRDMGMIFNGNTVNVIQRKFASILLNKSCMNYHVQFPSKSLLKSSFKYCQFSTLSRHGYPVVAMHVAESINISKLLPFLSNPQIIQSSTLNSAIISFNCNLNESRVFIFQTGSIVIWNSNEGVLSRVMELLCQYLIDPINNIEKEEMICRLGNKNDIEGDKNIIISIQQPSSASSLSSPPSSSSSSMSSNSNSIQEERLSFHVINESCSSQTDNAMLPFSNGLADSVRLAHLESSFDNFWNQYINHIPRKLLQSSSLFSFDITRKKVLKITGLLLEFRASLYNTTIADSTISDLYWDRPDLEKLYIKMGSILENRKRFIALNRKMDYANELVGVLRTHLSEQHGLKLEWGIITLIAVEVLFELMHLIN